MKIRSTYIPLLFLLFLSVSVFAQKKDSVLVLQRIAEAEQLIVQKQLTEARKKLKQAYKLANLNYWVLHKAQCAHMLGEIAFREENLEGSLEQYVKATQLFQSIQELDRLQATNLGIAKLYTHQQHYGKALKYYEQVKTYKESKNKPVSLPFLRLLASLHTQEKQYEEAQEYLQRLIAVGPQTEKTDLYLWLVKNLEAQNKLDHAFAVLEQAEKRVPEENLKERVEILNAKAYLQKRKGNTIAAEATLQQALLLLEQWTQDSGLKAVLYKNIGVTYTNLASFARAKEHYTKALDYWSKKNKPIHVARMHNFIAANYYLSGNVDKARISAAQALRMARNLKAYQVQAESYEIIAKVAPSEGEAERYTKLQQQAQERYDKIERESETKQLAKQVAIEAIEDDIQKRIAEQLETDRKLQQLAIESENRKRDIALKANELTLLRREREIRQIELQNKELARQRASQQLAATKAKAMADEFKRQEEIQRLLVSKRDAEKNERDKQIQLLQKEKSFQQLQLREEENMKKYWALAFILILLMLAVVGLALFGAKRSSKKLRKQKEQIEEQSVSIQQAHSEIITQNEELTQYQEELMVQRDNLSKRNKELDKQNRKVAQSIRSATIIQSAILLPNDQITEILKEHFILFWPKDVVSGDFYWITQIRDKTYVAAVDCTGHGVPGALMSLIANSLLNKVVKIEKQTDPGEILTALHHDVHEELKQGTTGNSDGMDMALVAITEGHDADGNVLVEFAGAKRPLHYILPSDGQINELPGDRISIGGKSRKERIFETKALNLPTDTKLYLSSDGFSDQNNKNRKRLGNKRFMQLLEESHKQSLLDQRSDLEVALTKQMLDTEQRDDILVIGLRV